MDEQGQVGSEPVGSKAEMPENRREALRKIEARRRVATTGLDFGSVVWHDENWQPLSNPENAERFVKRPGLAGLALSGGGIRSATLSLGLIEALASRGRFYGFDLLSTVSGGGYCGSFVRSLFIVRVNQSTFEQLDAVRPDVAKGAASNRAIVDPEDAKAQVLEDRIAFADASLTSLPDQQFFRSSAEQTGFLKPGKTVKNPMWWLRENGRYLAPGGMSAYGYALTYIVRNWVTSLLYLLAMLMLGFGVLQLLLYLPVLAVHLFLDGAIDAWLTHWHLSPLLPVLCLASLLGTGIAAAYWLSIPFPYLLPFRTGSERKGVKTLVAVISALLLLYASLVFLVLTASQPKDVTGLIWTGIGLSVIPIALVSGALTIWNSESDTWVDFRRDQTRALATYNLWFLALCCIALIDCAALTLRYKLDNGLISLWSGGVGAALAPTLSVLIAKLPDWFGGEKSSIGKLLVAHTRQAALFAAILILGSVALAADLLILKLFWHGEAWNWRASWFDWPTFLFVMLIVGGGALSLSRSRNFVNLLALTPFYGSRLTRAYLGASNARRLDISTTSDITHGMPGDDLALQRYMSEVVPAPFHLINVTRNRTVGDPHIEGGIDVRGDDPFVEESTNDPRGRLSSYESSLTLYDRHGDRMVFGPFGVRVGGEFFNWEDMKPDTVPSLGLLAAVSGAAVGSGMGRHTSLGTAMAMTLANVRLGFWWTEQKRSKNSGTGPSNDKGPQAEGNRGASPAEASVGDAVDISAKPNDAEKRKVPWSARWRDLVDRNLPGLACLSRELLGQFDTKHHWYLSDGGHSENSGALSLLERGCDLIIVADNAQDEGYRFGDLEIFIRTARTDIGIEVSVVKSENFPSHLMLPPECFLNSGATDWRIKITEADNQAFALLLSASDIPYREDGHWKRRREGQRWIIWLKPNRFQGLPADLATYARLNPQFPQQPTSNQFFDEAQWESYRRLGFEMGRRLFARRRTLSAFLPIIYRKSRVSRDAQVGVEVRADTVSARSD